MREKRRGIYGIVAAISYFIRQFLLPNPFSSFEYGELINFLAGGLIALIAYVIVGMIYNVDLPVLGSILFLGVYTVINVELTATLFFYPNWWLVLLVGIGFVAVDYSVVHFTSRKIVG